MAKALRDDNIRTTINTAAADRWGSPQWLYDRLDSEFEFAIDLAAEESNRKHTHYLGPDHRDRALRNALEVRWAEACGEEDGIGFFNPPFSLLAQFMVHAIRQWRRDRFRSVALIPVKTEQPWAHRVLPQTENRFLRGRLVYEKRNDDGEMIRDTARFPSMVVVIGSPAKGQLRMWDWKRDRYR